VKVPEVFLTVWLGGETVEYDVFLHVKDSG
jgi:hypothetical protein